MGKAKYSKEFKRDILLRDIPKSVRQLKKDAYFECDYETMDLLRNARKTTDFTELDCALRIIESDYRKQKRIRDKLEVIALYPRPVFVTLTFTDKTLQETTEQERRRLVQRFLKKQAAYYVANIDYGGKNGREHYHAVVCRPISCSEWLKYGSIDFERLHNKASDQKAVSKYLTKLTNHALKNKNLDIKLIYSRDYKSANI